MEFFKNFFTPPQEIPKGRLDPEGGDDFGPIDHDNVEISAEEQRINMRLMMLRDKFAHNQAEFTHADGDEMEFLERKLENLQVSKKYVN